VPLITNNLLEDTISKTHVSGNGKTKPEIGQQGSSGSRHGALSRVAEAQSTQNSQVQIMILPTLDEMIADRIVVKEADQYAYAVNSYVREDGFKFLYVRMIKHWFKGAARDPVLDLANFEVKKPGKGTFTRLIERLRQQYPTLTLRVEVVHEKRFRDKLESMGFEHDGCGSFVLLPQNHA